MLCDHCQQRRAVIEMNVQINDKKQRLHLCESCYRELRQEMNLSNGLVSGLGGVPMSFDNLLKGFMQPSLGGQGPGNPQKREDADASQGNSRDGLLAELGSNLSQAARNGLLDPVIGRDKEVNQVIEALSRRTKNNPVLIGEPGVGKTAIVEGLAMKIAEGNVPTKLKDKEIYLLDVSSLVANTGIRGQFEERMRELIAELKERKDIIVFVDEVHLLVGAGQAEGGSMDAGNILKPALARGDIQLVGATTLKEYRKIEKDAALERRLQPVMVGEPTSEETVEILQGLKERYEKYHEVSYTDEAIRACVTLAERYIQDRFLPDKAIDLMDEAGAKVSLSQNHGEKETLNERLADIRKEKEGASKHEDYERAARLRDEEKKIQEQMASASEEGKQQAVVDAEVVQAIVENKTGIPVRKLQREEQVKMKNLAERLNARVIGQEEAVQKVARAVRRSRAGLRRSTRPIGSFLFVGPTGVGKTELARVLAEELFGDRDMMIRLDMSEYMEKHSVAKLIGSPPGYVGYEEAGQLTERVRRRPYSLILLDEIEKAHPDVQHMFLQIMEDGRLTDSQGRTVSFKDTLLIMTSNAVDGAGPQGAAEKSKEEEKLLELLTPYFKPEFLNRFDAIVHFHPLSGESLLKIVDLMLREVYEMVQEQGKELEVTEEAKAQLAELGYHPAYGARPLRRVIEEQVEDQIADLLLDEEEVKHIVVNVEDGRIKVKAGMKMA